MAEEMQNTAAPQQGPVDIKALEEELKSSFKEERFDAVKATLEKLKDADPENRIASRIGEKLADAESAAAKKQKAGEIKQLEEKIKAAFKEGKLPEVANIASQLKEIDPENKTVSKIEAKVEGAKAALDAQVKKESLKKAVEELKNLESQGNGDEVLKKANEILGLEWGQKEAMKAIEKQAKEKNVDAMTLITVKAPVEGMAKEAKPGLFSKLFGKKNDEKAEENTGPATLEVKPSEPETTATVATPAPAPAAPVLATPAAPQETPAVAAPVAPVEEKAETPAAPDSVEPVAASSEAAPEPVPSEVAEKTIPAKEAPAPAKLELKNEEAPKAEAKKGNMFTSLFGKKEDIDESKNSIIDKIVAKKAQPEKMKRAPARSVKRDESMGENAVKNAKLVLSFALFFIAISAGFFYVQNIDIENKYLSLVGIEENYASRLHKANATIAENIKKENLIRQEIARYEGGYQDNNIETVDAVRKKRLDWYTLINKVNEVTETVYESNALLQYVKYSNYSYDVDTEQLNVNAELVDPTGYNLTRLAELEEAFDESPEFHGLRDFQSYSKTLDKDTGRFKSTFSLSLHTSAEESEGEEEKNEGQQGGEAANEPAIPVANPVSQ